MSGERGGRVGGMGGCDERRGEGERGGREFVVLERFNKFEFERN